MYMLSVGMFEQQIVLFLHSIVLVTMLSYL